MCAQVRQCKKIRVHVRACESVRCYVCAAGAGPGPVQKMAGAKQNNAVALVDQEDDDEVSTHRYTHPFTPAPANYRPSLWMNACSSPTPQHQDRGVSDKIPLVETLASVQ